MKRIVLILLTALFVVSCSEELTDLNQNKKDPATVNGETLFASAQKSLVDQILSTNVNQNNLRLFVQHWQETTYLEESRYDQSTRPIPDNHWNAMYRDVLKNLDESAKLIEATDNAVTNAEKPNKLAIIEILSVYTFSNLVETFGDIPYSEALDIDNTIPVYDDAQTVYLALVSRLNSALTSINSAGAFSEAEDLIYGGDINKWRKFGNTLKLRMGITLADFDEPLASTIVQEAYQDGVFEGNNDDAGYLYSSAAPNNNPINNELVLTGRNDFVAAHTLTGILNNLNDPRRMAYFDPNINEVIAEVSSATKNGDLTTIQLAGQAENTPSAGDIIFIEDGTDTPNLVGIATSNSSGSSVEVDFTETVPAVGDRLIIGVYKGGDIGEASTYSEHSHANRKLVDPTNPGVILSFVEAKFLLAEAAQRGFIESKPYAETFYKEAITASFEKWGVPGIDDYLGKSEVQYDANNWQKTIGTQAWIALYNRPFALYLSVRRLDYPVMTEPRRAESGYPVRYPYPVNEENLNEANWAQASDNIGGDFTETRLFWDVHPHNWF